MIANNQVKAKSLLNRAALTVAASAFVLSFAVSDCRAEEASLPAMSGITELLVQYTRFGNPKASDECGISNGEMDASLIKSIKSFGVPAISAIEAKPKTENMPRIEILPEIITAKNTGNDCTSWISLTVQTQNSLRIPPINMNRNVLVVYWRGGLIVNSDKAAHARSINEAWDKISNLFSIQYKNDQPPIL